MRVEAIPVRIVRPDTVLSVLVSKTGVLCGWLIAIPFLIGIYAFIIAGYMIWWAILLMFYFWVGVWKIGVAVVQKF